MSKKEKQRTFKFSNVLLIVLVFTVTTFWRIKSVFIPTEQTKKNSLGYHGASALNLTGEGRHVAIFLFCIWAFECQRTDDRQTGANSSRFLQQFLATVLKTFLFT